MIERLERLENNMSELRGFRYVLPALSENLLGMVGLRNLLVHEYVRLDTGRLYGLLESVDDFAHFVEAVRDSV